MTDEDVAYCVLCGDDDGHLQRGWFSFDQPLCRSCRHEVVVAHDKAHPNLHPWSGQNYAHVRLARREGSKKRLLEGHEPRPTKNSLPYYPSVKAFIIAESLLAPQERKKYSKASQLYRGAFEAPAVTTARLAPIQSSGILEEAQQKKEARQLNLFAMFPPEK